MLALVEDLATAKLQGLIQSEVRNVLVQAGLIDRTEVAPTMSLAKKPKLDLIINDNPVVSKSSEQTGQPFDPEVCK
jgi:hypothetical protein